MSKQLPAEYLHITNTNTCRACALACAVVIGTSKKQTNSCKKKCRRTQSICEQNVNCKLPEKEKYDIRKKKKSRDDETQIAARTPSCLPRFPPVPSQTLAQYLEGNPSFEDVCSAKETYSVFALQRPRFFLLKFLDQ